VSGNNSFHFHSRKEYSSHGFDVNVSKLARVTNCKFSNVLSLCRLSGHVLVLVLLEFHANLGLDRTHVPKSIRVTSGLIEYSLPQVDQSTNPILIVGFALSFWDLVKFEALCIRYIFSRGFYRISTLILEWVLSRLIATTLSVNIKCTKNMRRKALSSRANISGSSES